MTKKILLILVLVSFPLFSIAQDIPNKLSKQLCKCLEKESVTNIEDIGPCFEKILVKNFDNIFKYYGVDTIDEIDFEKLGDEIGALLINECDYMSVYLANPINKFEEDFKPEKNLECSQLHAGDFYYLEQNPITQASDTTFVTIKGNMYLERMKSGRKYSLLDINWVSDCQFELIFKDSNDHFKSKLSEKTKKYNYEMVASTPQSFIIKAIFKDQELKFELFSIK